MKTISEINIENIEKPFFRNFAKEYDIPKPRLSPYQERILRVISIAMRPLTTRQVGKYSGISYNSAKKNLEELFRMKIIKKKDLGNRIYWQENNEI